MSKDSPPVPTRRGDEYSLTHRLMVYPHLLTSTILEDGCLFFSSRPQFTKAYGHSL